MRKNLTEIVINLDRSGSISRLESDTIGDFESMVEKQKNTEGGGSDLQIFFDNTNKASYDRVSIQNIKPMTRENHTNRD